jgi:hypothetical protein
LLTIPGSNSNLSTIDGQQASTTVVVAAKRKEDDAAAVAHATTATTHQAQEALIATMATARKTPAEARARERATTVA